MGVSAAEGGPGFTGRVIGPGAEGWCRRASSRAGGAFEVGGALPGAELLGLAGVFVVHDGVELLHVLDGAAEDLANEGGAFDAFLRFALVALVGGAEGIAIGAEVGDEILRQFVGDEFRVGARPWSKAWPRNRRRLRRVRYYPRSG